MGMEQDTKQERKPEGNQSEGQGPQGQATLGWRVPDEEIDRVIKKLEEGWGF